MEQKKEFSGSITIADIASDIGPGLASAAIAGKVNQDLVDISIPIDYDAEIKIITAKDKEGVEIIRHSFAHLIGHAVKQLYPDAKMAIGPIIEDGFYYDISYSKTFTPEDLARIEERIKDLIKLNYDVVVEIVSRDKALNTFKDRNEPYKVEIINNIPEGETIKLYKHQEYIDMCRGPHVPNTKHLNSFKLMRVSGAYWRGDSDNEMLQRIYGTAWANKKRSQSLYK